MVVVHPMPVRLQAVADVCAASAVADGDIDNIATATNTPTPPETEADDAAVRLSPPVEEFCGEPANSAILEDSSFALERRHH